MMNSEQRVIPLQIRIDPAEAAQTLQPSPSRSPASRLIELARGLIAETRSLLCPMGVYVIHDVEEMTESALRMHGCPVIEGPIARFLKPARRVAAFVATVGPQIESAARHRMDRGDILEGHLLDAIGTVAADAAADALIDHMLWNDVRPDEAVLPPLCPGYCGLPLDQQTPLFAIVDAGAIGVQLSPAMAIRPLKSVSGLVGIGNHAEVLDHGVPCEWCDQEQCGLQNG